MSAVDELLSRPLVARAGRAITRSRLRVLAMHGVDDVAAFESQLTELLRWFQPVSSVQVAESISGGPPLPDRPIWITFDDGEHSTIVDGATVLGRLGVPATMFVCPAFIDGASTPWWEVVTDALDAGHPVTVGSTTYSDAHVLTVLKRVADDERRAIIDSLPDAARVATRPRPTVDDLQRWRDLGGDLGNHTWDHPCLSRCAPDDQRDQIDRGAAWLDRHSLWEHRIFAYPDGNRSEVAEEHLRSEGYRLVTLFDHALVARPADRYAISRLRLDAGASIERSRAVTSGWHSALLGLRTRLRRQPTER